MTEDTDSMSLRSMRLSDESLTSSCPFTFAMGEELGPPLDKFRLKDFFL